MLWIQDATDEDHGTIDEPLRDGVAITVVRNKIDLQGAVRLDDAVNISAKTGEGLDALRQKIKTLAGHQNLGEGAFTARKRHVHALERAAIHFATGTTALEEAHAGELLAEELRLAQHALGEITGEVSSDDLLGRIFSEFCIGK